MRDFKEEKKMLKNLRVASPATAGVPLTVTKHEPDYEAVSW